VERLLVSTQKRKSPKAAGRDGELPRPGPAGQRHPVHLHGADRGRHRLLRGHPPRRRRGRGRRPLRLQPAKPIIDVTRIVSLIRSKLQPTARAATVRCGAARVRVVAIGASIGCTITLGDAVQKVTAVVKDLEGTVVVRGWNG
jgi:hypothetical protein